MIKILKQFFRWTPVWYILFIAIGVRLFLFEGFLVLNSEMLPTLLKNDYVLVKKYTYGLSLPLMKKNLITYRKPKRGEVVLMKAPYAPHPLVIRRVIAVEGDRLFYSKGTLHLNEKVHALIPPEGLLKKEFHFLNFLDFPGNFFLDRTWSDKNLSKIGEHWQESIGEESYSVFVDREHPLSFGPYKIPENHVFVMGDNRVSSQDSRTWPVKGKHAQGDVTFYRKKNSSSPIVIPRGTEIIVQDDPFFSIFFETKQEVTLLTDEITVPVRAQASGLLGNVPADVYWKVKGSLSSVLDVKNTKPFSGGQDYSLVPYELIKGKVSTVMWGCEKPVEFLKFLCHFKSFRKNRWFWLVHKK